MMNDTDNNDNNNHHGSSVENRNIEDDVQVIPHTSTDIPNPHPRQPPTLDTNRTDMSAGRHPNDLPSYKDQTRTVVGYASNDENENTKAVDGSNQTTNVPIAEAIAYPESGIFAVTATHDVGAVGTITPTTAATTINHNAATQRPPPPLPIPLIKHESRNESEISGRDTKSWWTCTRIATLGMILVVVAAAVMTSVILCRDGNCRRTTPSSSMDTSKKNATTTTTTTTIYFMEDDLVTLQNAVDEYYAALSTIGPIDETNDEWMNVPVLRQYGYPISTWDVSRVTNFTSLFDGKRNEQLIDTFNEDLGDWNVSSGIDMFRMFGKLNIYEGNGLEHWDVSNVINMRSMFHEAYQFRGNVSMWDIQKVKTLTRLFSDCYIFNIDISSWKTNNAESMAWMFFDARIFNQDISNWDVRKVLDFSEMVRLSLFQKANDFNQNISGWTVTSAKEMQFMFEGALSFNQDLSSWDVRNNEQFYNMFTNARSFNQSLCPWSLAIQATTNVTGMFSGTSCLNTSDPTSSGGPFLSNGPFCHPCN